MIACDTTVISLFCVAMSWTSNGFFRNVNILKNFTEATGDQLIDFYQPGTLNSFSKMTDVRYSGFITSLRLQVAISSIAAVQFPVPEIGQSEAELNAVLAGIKVAAPKKRLVLSMRSSDSDAVIVGSLDLFNRLPYYTVDILVYFTDASSFDVASDCILSARIAGAGFGLLSGSDRVSLHGSVVEEGENTAPSLIVNIFGSGGGSGGSSGSVVTNDAGEPITDSQLNIIDI